MRKLYITKWINRPEMKFYLVLDYTLPSMSPKSTQVEIHNDGGSLGLVMSFKTLSRLSHLIKRESLMFSLRPYCLDFPIFIMIDSKFHFLLNQKHKWYMYVICRLWGPYGEKHFKTEAYLWKMATKVWMYSATHKSVTVTRG